MDFTSGIVQILNNEGEIEGTGFVISPDGMIVTCAHVIQGCAPQMAGQSIPQSVHVRFQVNPIEQEACVETSLWRSPNEDDIAFLKLQGDLPSEVTPLKLASTKRAKGHTISTFGFPKIGKIVGSHATQGRVSGAVKEKGMVRFQLEEANAITEGFSGAPVWDETDNCAIGMIVGVLPSDRLGKQKDVAYFIPSEDLKQVYPPLRLSSPPLVKLNRNSFIAVAMVAVIIVVALSAGLYYWLNPAKMTGDFRIAVAGFAVAGQANSSTGKELAQGVYLGLKQEFDDLKLGFTITIWGPDQVGAVTGVDAKERAMSARQLAEKIGADVIVYGLVDVSNPIWQVIPEFYVSSHNFYEADEVTGEHQIGEPFSLTGQGDLARRIQLSSKFGSRVQAISKITVGLTYYSVREYDKALSFFQSAESIKEWEDAQGKQVVYLLLGSISSKKKDYETAKSYYQKSLSIDPQYARPHIGLGGVYYLLALKPIEVSKKDADLDVTLLDIAIDHYQRALRSENQPPLADIPTKAHFGLGQCYLYRTYSGRDKTFNAAVKEFNMVIADYGNGTNPRVRELAAESHARLGLIVYDTGGDLTLAANKYQTAATLLYDNPERQTLYVKRAQDIREVIKTTLP